MTRHDAIEHLEVIKAFANGEDIQMLLGDEWVDVNEPAFSRLTTYRVKPKLEYVPFDFSDGQKIIRKVVCCIGQEKTAMITLVDGDGVVISCNLYLRFKDLLEDWTFSDGSPCGKLKP